MSRRGLRVLVGLACTGVTTLGFSVAAQGASTTTLQILWADWGPLYNDLMQKIGEKYMAEHPGVKLEWNFASGWQDKLTTLISAGLSPDVTYTNWVGLPNLARSGALLPLDQLAQKEGWSRSQFVPAMWDAVWHDGRMYAVPGGGDYIALFFNKDVFAETGLDPERPPRTVWDLERYSDKIIRTDGQGNLLRLGYTPGDFLYWASIFGG